MIGEPSALPAGPEARLGLICAALVAGEALGLSTSGGAVAWPLACGAALLVALFGFSRKWRFWPAAFSLFLGLALAMRAADARHEALTAIELRNGPYEGVFDVTGEPSAGDEDAGGARWVSFPSSYPGGKLNVTFRQFAVEDAPHVGETWKCAGWLDRQKEGDPRPRRLWVKGRGTFAERVRTAEPHAPVVLLARAKRDLSRRLGLGLEDRPLPADLNRAMVLGQRTDLPWEMRQDFVRSGTMHVFAISGLHVMVVARVFLYVLVLAAFPVRWAGLLLIPLLWLYTLLIGAPPSAVRATAMSSIYYAAPFFCRRPDSLMAWEWTLVAFALIDPIALFGVGSMMSFTVMFGILLFIRWARPFGSRVLTALGVPCVAWAAGVPIAAHVFSRVTPGGLLANMIEVPLAGAAVMASVGGVAVSFVSHRLAAHVNNLAALFTEAMAGVSWAVARLPGADMTIIPWPLPLCAAWYAGLILLFVWVRMVWTRRRGSLA